VLTPRELEVLELVSRGMRNRVISTELGISETTVAVHIKNIFVKLKVSDRTSAVHVAIRRGFVHIA
jgi:DNA-binding NarL/FixJ family response regulator